MKTKTNILINKSIASSKTLVMLLMIFINFNIHAQGYKSIYYKYTPRGNGYEVEMNFQWKFIDCNFSSDPQINLGIMLNPSKSSSKIYIYNGVRYDLDNLGITANLNVIKSADVSGDIFNGSSRLGNLQMYTVTTGKPNCFQYSYNISGYFGISYKENRNKLMDFSLSNIYVSRLSIRDYKVESKIKELLKKEADMAKAKEHIKNGDMYYERQEYTKALQEYAKAKYLSPEDKPYLEGRISLIQELKNDNSNSNKQNYTSSSYGNTNMTSREDNSTKTQSTSNSAENETTETTDYDYDQANRDRRAEAEAQQQKAIDDAAFAAVMLGGELVDAIDGSRLYLALSYGTQFINNTNAHGNFNVPEKGKGYNEINFCFGTRLYWGPVYWIMEYGIGMHIYSGWIFDYEEVFMGSAPTLQNWEYYKESSQKDMFARSFDKGNYGSSDDETTFIRYKYDKNTTLYNFSIKTGLGFSVPISNRVIIDAEVNVAMRYNIAFINKQISESIVIWVLPEYRVIVNVGRMGFGIGLANPLYFSPPPDTKGEESYLMEEDARISRTQPNTPNGDGRYIYNGRVEYYDEDGNPEKRRNYSKFWSLTLLWTLSSD